MACSNCSQLLPGLVRFCPKCGAQITATAVPVKNARTMWIVIKITLFVLVVGIIFIAAMPAGFTPEQLKQAEQMNAQELEARAVFQEGARRVQHLSGGIPIDYPYSPGHVNARGEGNFSVTLSAGGVGYACFGPVTSLRCWPK